MYKRKQIGLLIINFIVFQWAYAATSLIPTTYVLKEALIHGRGVLQLGGFGSIQGQSQHINIDSLIGDSFNVTKRTDGNFLLGVGYFIDGTAFKHTKINYGLNWFYLAKTQVKGTVLQEDDYTNLAYSYNVTNYPLYVVAKSTFESLFLGKDVSFDVGIGPNFMSTSHFQESPLDANVLPDSIFSGTTNTTFSVTAGAQLTLQNFIRSTQIGLSYRFFYLGQSDFKSLTNQTLNTLTTGNVFANALVFTIII